MALTLMALSLKRNLSHPRIAGEDMDASEIRFNRINAMSKLASPLLMCAAAFIVPPEYIRTRYLSISLGCALSLLTKKMIVFSMAKMPFAILQTDIFPFIFATIWIRYDTKLTKEGGDFILGVLCFWYAYRLLRWVNVSIEQICAKLGIYCFRLKKRDD
jgi:ethanolaminephosphotransferase